MTIATFDQTVTNVTAAIIEAGKGRGKVAALFKTLAAEAYGDLAKQKEVADILTAIRREVHAKADQAARRMAPGGCRTTFKKAVENALVYGLRVAGRAAGCKFKFNQSTKIYEVADAPAAGEPTSPSASGKDENVADQSRALADAAEAAAVLVAGDRLAHLQGIVTKLIGAGYTLDEIESAVHAVAMIEGKRRTDAELASKATEPKAPAIVADKLAATMAAKGAKVKAPRKAKAKPADKASKAA